MSRYLRFIFIWCCWLLQVPAAHSQSVAQIDSALATLQRAASDSAYIRTCFFIADAYMDGDQYDSAQIWLNKIHERVPVKKASLFNYYLLSRQAEVYYYNNLQQLGLQESKRALDRAEQLGDGLLIADGCNFIGLFLLNMDSLTKAIPYFYKGLASIKPPPYPDQYINLTFPHHLYGNLAEAYLKLAKLDSSIYASYQSLSYATAIGRTRGMAIAHINLGEVFLAKGRPDSAIQHFEIAGLLSGKSQDIDVEQMAYGGLGRAYLLQGNFAMARQQFGTGMQLMVRFPQLNRFFALQFLGAVAKAYRQMNDRDGLATVLEKMNTLQSEALQGTNQQLQIILNASIDNEKRLLSMEVGEARQAQTLANSRFFITLISMALLAIVFWLYYYYQKQRNAMNQIRQKISQDLHDDIGASLSSLQIYGTIARQTMETEPPKAAAMIDKIVDQSNELMDNMSDIVWSMQPADEQTASLQSRIKNYGAELLYNQDIAFEYQILPEVEKCLEHLLARKNVLLIVKEAINNIAKYSQATAAQVQLSIHGAELVVDIKDNGCGFDVHKEGRDGNGLRNMRHRTQELRGQLQLHSAPGQGTHIHVRIPLTSLGRKSAIW